MVYEKPNYQNILLLRPQSLNILQVYFMPKTMISTGAV